jgi:hypothetical protein
MADMTDEDKIAVRDAAADAMGSPKNRSADYNISGEDAIAAAYTISQGGEYKATTKGDGKLVELPNGVEVWIPRARFNRLVKINERDRAELQKQGIEANVEKATNARKSRERAARDEQNRKDGPGLLGDQSVPPPTVGGVNPQSTLDSLQELMK